MVSIDSFNFKGLKAIVRVDFNVPFDKVTQQVKDDTRIRGALPTIRKIIDDGGAVILMTHFGRPKGWDEKLTVEPLLKPLSAHLGREVKFAGDCRGEKVTEMAASLQPGDVLLLENVRFYPEEEAKPLLGDTATEAEVKQAKKLLKEKQKVFASELASLADAYVNDAFGTAHRAHATTAVIADHFPPEKRMFGFLMKGEIKAIDKILDGADHPFTAIMGGAKVSDKIGVIRNLIGRVDTIVVGGGMAYTFIKAMGGDIGDSLCECDKLDLALSLLQEAKEKWVKIILPVDSLNGDRFEIDARADLSNSFKIPDGWRGLDIGPQSIEEFREVILSSKTILWNGPMGVFEFEDFAEGTIAIAKAIAEATENGAYSLVGGGDSVAAVNKYNLKDSVSYVSTGGGALLEYIEGKELPGIVAIRGY